MEKKREKEVVCDWEFKVPLTISVVTHYDLGYAGLKGSRHPLQR